MLIDDAVQALKVNDTEKPTVHLYIPNQQAANICKFNFISISRGNSQLPDFLTSAAKSMNHNCFELLKAGESRSKVA